MNHLLALMPFNAIATILLQRTMLPRTKYNAMSKGFMELLPWLIPGSTSSQISAILALFGMSPGMGTIICGGSWS
jgi:hypothetical protein